MAHPHHRKYVPTQDVVKWATQDDDRSDRNVLTTKSTVKYFLHKYYDTQNEATAALQIVGLPPGWWNVNTNTELKVMSIPRVVRTAELTRRVRFEVPMPALAWQSGSHRRIELR